MKVFLGADHRGFVLKEKIQEFLESENYEVVDLGAENENPEDDYVDFASRVGRKVAEEGALGVVICGSGVGVDVAANKIKGVRAGLGFREEQVRNARRDDDINVLSLASDFIDESSILSIVEVFLTTDFSGEERHLRRLQKLKELENHA